jgi:hypothetical protein
MVIGGNCKHMGSGASISCSIEDWSAVLFWLNGVNTSVEQSLLQCVISLLERLVILFDGDDSVFQCVYPCF